MILNRAERMLARRYLLPGKGEGFIFLVASISLIAVALGVAALIIVMSVMNGFAPSCSTRSSDSTATRWSRAMMDASPIGNGSPHRRARRPALRQPCR